ncbi:hypothetical protein [Actinocrispum wychmicini]|uniref:Uncharacterized protein n=1 Tax=Actinocrispum wychmicini TaxID=1213861 RepID=A0A4R2JQF9_9PSEU|nr:hypothetical protein [Actinocrispum wychmicini]TCO59426.1 hypothetical protein EV192_104268 [Actinocrispum wychmicini]
MPLRGVAGIPADTTAVIVNVTRVVPTASTYLEVTPGGPGDTSTLNLDQGAVRANLAVVGVGADGAIRVRNAQGSLDVVVDVQGWFSPQATVRYVPLAAPLRILDSRADGNGRFGPGMEGHSVIPCSPEPGQAILNVTGVQPTVDTFVYPLTFFNGKPNTPTTSIVNVSAGAVVANAMLSGCANQLGTDVGSIVLVVDEAGYFTPTIWAEPRDH